MAAVRFHSSAESALEKYVTIRVTGPSREQWVTVWSETQSGPVSGKEGARTKSLILGRPTYWQLTSSTINVKYSGTLRQSQPGPDHAHLRRSTIHADLHFLDDPRRQSAFLQFRHPASSRHHLGASPHHLKRLGRALCTLHSPPGSRTLLYRDASSSRKASLGLRGDYTSRYTSEDAVFDDLRHVARRSMWLIARVPV